MIKVVFLPRITNFSYLTGESDPLTAAAPPDTTEVAPSRNGSPSTVAGRENQNKGTESDLKQTLYMAAETGNHTKNNEGESNQTKSRPTYAAAVSQRRVPENRIAPRTSVKMNGIIGISFSDDEIKLMTEDFKFCLVMKFLRKRPSVEVIRRTVLRTWGLLNPPTADITVLDHLHVLIQFSSDRDLAHSWTREGRILEGQAFRLFRWTPDFTVEKESSLAPVWVHLPDLPVHLYRRDTLHSIGALLGRYLGVDNMTLLRTRSEYYCSKCWSQGHQYGNCPDFRSKLEEVWKQRGKVSRKKDGADIDQEKQGIEDTEAVEAELNKKKETKGKEVVQVNTIFSRLNVDVVETRGGVSEKGQHSDFGKGDGESLENPLAADTDTDTIRRTPELLIPQEKIFQDGDGIRGNEPRKKSHHPLGKSEEEIAPFKELRERFKTVAVERQAFKNSMREQVEGLIQNFDMLKGIFKMSEGSMNTPRKSKEKLEHEVSSNLMIEEKTGLVATTEAKEGQVDDTQEELNAHEFGHGRSMLTHESPPQLAEMHTSAERNPIPQLTRLSGGKSKKKGKGNFSLSLKSSGKKIEMEECGKENQYEREGFDMEAMGFTSEELGRIREGAPIFLEEDWLGQGYETIEPSEDEETLKNWLNRAREKGRENGPRNDKKLAHQSIIQGIMATSTHQEEEVEWRAGSAGEENAFSKKHMKLYDSDIDLQFKRKTGKGKTSMRTSSQSIKFDDDYMGYVGRRNQHG